MYNFICRGRTDRGDWVEGYLIQAPKFCGILEEESKVHPMDYPYLDGSTGCIDGYVTPVNPTTVGRWTHLRDVTGRLIFEGDIVERVRKVEGQPRRMYVVDHRGSWMLWNGPDDDDFLWNWCAPATDHGVQVGGCIIVGNIHDNPELLEETNDL